MKKVFVLLMLALAVIFAAGCVTTEDGIVGTWECTYDDGSTTMVFLEDNTGLTTETDNDGTTKLSPTIWIPMGDGSYFVETLYLLTFEEDGTMTSESGSVYTLEGDKFGGVWTYSDEEGSISFVFNEDNSGKITLDEGGEIASYQISWVEYGENQITFTYIREYFYDENGVFSTTSSKDYELIDGIWTSTNDGEVTTYQFFDNGVAVRQKYDAETREVTSESWMQWKDKEDGTGGDFYYYSGSLAQMGEGTLIIEGETFYPITS